MSWLSKAVRKVGKGLKRLTTDPGKWVKNVGKSVGQAADLAGDVVQFVPGVGQLVRPILEVGGSVLQGNNMKGHLGAALESVPIPGLSKIPGFAQLGDKIGGFAGGKLGDLIPDGIERAVGGGLKRLGGVGDVLGKAGQWALDNPTDALAAFEGARGVYDTAQQYHQRNKALRSAEGAYNERAGLRRLGVEGMMNEQRPDLGSVFSDPANPYQARGLRRVGGL